MRVKIQLKEFKSWKTNWNSFENENTWKLETWFSKTCKTSWNFLEYSCSNLLSKSYSYNPACWKNQNKRQILKTSCYCFLSEHRSIGRSTDCSFSKTNCWAQSIARSTRLLSKKISQRARSTGTQQKHWVCQSVNLSVNRWGSGPSVGQQTNIHNMHKPLSKEWSTARSTVLTYNWLWSTVRSIDQGQNKFFWVFLNTKLFWKYFVFFLKRYSNV